MDEIIVDQALNYLNNEQAKKLISAYRMLIYLAFVSHFFANIWMLIGYYQYERGDGWIFVNE